MEACWATELRYLIELLTLWGPLLKLERHLERNTSGDGHLRIRWRAHHPSVLVYPMRKTLLADAYLRGGVTDNRIFITHRWPRRD